MGIAGGTLTLQGLSLALPAAALTETVDVSVQQETVASPALARFRFSPAGQALNAPAELKYSVAGLPANVRFFWEVNGEQWMIPGTVSGGVLTSLVTSLGYGAAGTVLPVQARAQAALVADRVQAASARLLPQAEAAEGGSVVVQPVDCDAQIAVLKTRLLRAANDGDQSRAVGVFNELEAIQDVCLSAKIRELEQASCDASARAQANAQVLIASSLESFSELTVPLFATQAFVENTGATCTSGDPVANMALIEAKFDQLLDVMKGQMARAEFDDDLTVRDLGVVMSMESMCQRLDLEAVCGRLTSELYPDLLDALRAAAFEECRVNATPLAVSQFYALGSRAGNPEKFFDHGRFALTAVEADLSYCRNPSLGLRVFDGEAVPSELSDRAATLSPLVALGVYQKTRTIEVPRDGSLNIAGTVGVLRCPDGSASSADLVFRVNGQEWVRRAASGDTYPLENSPLLLDLPRQLPGLGIDPATSTGFTVLVNREGGACSDGERSVLNEPFTLFEVVVNLPAEAPPGGSFAGPVAISQEDYEAGRDLGFGSTLTRRESYRVTGTFEEISPTLGRLTGATAAVLYENRIATRRDEVGEGDCRYTLVREDSTLINSTVQLPTLPSLSWLTINRDQLNWRFSGGTIRLNLPAMTSGSIRYENIRGRCPADLVPRDYASTPVVSVTVRVSALDPGTQQPGLSGAITGNHQTALRISVNGGSDLPNSFGGYLRTSVSMQLSDR
ncbi:MAG: hypothetical protein MUF44_08890 [Hydrogenophaga sp.]|nr:hypothetical protein [Hydrogenophaga sp.]